MEVHLKLRDGKDGYGTVLMVPSSGNKEIYPNGKLAYIARRIWPTGFKAEAVSLIKVAIPVIVTNLAAFLIMTESIIMCGHLKDKYQMDGAALGNSIINALGISIGTGMCTACDTFFSQLYGSVTQKKRIGMVLQRSLMIVSLVPLLVWALHINSEPIFILIGQDPKVSLLASTYMLYFLPGILFSYHYLVLTRYLQNQDIVVPPMIAGALGNIFNVVSQYVAIYQFNKGIEASSICQACAYGIMWLYLLIYILASKVYKETWDGWTKEAFLDWGHFLGLAIPGVFMVSMETFCWEIGTFLSGLMGPVYLGIQSILFQLETITFMMTFGVSVAVNIRVGQALGANNAAKALTAYRAGAAIMFVTITIIAILFLCLSTELPKLFSDDEDIIRGTSEIFFVMIGVQIIDSIGTVTMGALRGCGRHKLGTVFIFCAYYILGQPIGISLAFLTDLKVQGLWIGLLVSLCISVTTVVIVVNRQNWQHQADKAQERIQLGLEKDNSLDDEDILEYTEETGLLDGNSHERKSRTTHRRTPSQPRLCSTSQVRIPKPKDLPQEKYSGFIILRFVTLLFMLLLLSAAILLKIHLPREAYWPANYNITSHG